MILNPKTAAQERFADPETLVDGTDLIGQLATDPPLIVRGLVDAIVERVRPGGRVIELGFGSGWLLEELRSQVPDVSLYALDLSPAQVLRCRRLYGDRVEFVAGDMEQLPFADAAFDVIVTCWTLYFMNDIDRALTEMKRCLTPNGRLIVAASAPDHEIEFTQIVAEAARTALGRELVDPDIGRRFDLETGAAYVERHFPKVELRTWPGEIVLTRLWHAQTLWPKWQPEGLDADEAERVRAAYESLIAERLAKDGPLRGRRRDGAFVCDLP